MSIFYTLHHYSLYKFKAPFERIRYDEAVDIINSKGVKLEWGEDFGTGHEKALTNDLKAPIHVTHFPRQIKAFYMKTLDGKTAECNDLLAPEGYGEIIGSSQREEDIKIITDNLLRDGSDIADYEWYLDLRRYGSVPHSGFGLGIERVMRWICNHYCRWGYIYLESSCCNSIYVVCIVSHSCIYFMVF